MNENKAFCPFYNYLNDFDADNKYYYDLLRYVLDQKIYYYGENYKHPHERVISISDRVKIKLKHNALFLNVIINSILNNTEKRDRIWSTAYFNIDKIIDFNKYDITAPPWFFSKKGLKLKNYRDFKKIIDIKKILDYGNVNQLLTKEFFDEVDKLKIIIKEIVIREDIKAVFLASDLGFFDKLIINIFKELGRPTFLFIHGLPGIYGKIDNNRTDFLVVWGSEIKKNYVDKGFKHQKIIVNGHPKYNLNSEIKLRHSLDNILVLPKSMNGAPMGDEYTLSDRGNSILYMIMIQNSLKKIGVKQVRFRPHPSESIKWYLKYLDNGFFKPDNESLDSSLNNSSLVIGPTSTVFIESLIYKVNYIVFEPRLSNGYCFSNFPVAKPFDGESVKVPTAKTEDELVFNIINSVKIDTSILDDYLENSFDPKIIIDRMNEFYDTFVK